MSRKAKGSGFKMRSGNSTPFKHMGSSPVKYTNPVTGESLNPYAPDVIQNMGAMGVSGDVMEQIIKQKAGKEIEVEDAKIDEGKKIDTETEIKKNVSKVEDIKKVKPKKTKMEKLRAKQKRSSKGQSEWEYRKSKEYKDSKKTTDKVEKPVDLTKQKVSTTESGSGGADFTDVSTKFTPTETSELSFGDTFAAARKKFGPGKEFDYKGEKYTTDRADDTEKVAQKQTKIIKGKHGPVSIKPGTEHLFEGMPPYEENIILTDELNNPVVTEVPSVKEELKNKGFNYGDNKFDYSSPIEKKSPYKKGLGKYAKKAKGSRGYKMKRK